MNLHFAEFQGSTRACCPFRLLLVLVQIKHRHSGLARVDRHACPSICKQMDFGYGDECSKIGRDTPHVLSKLAAKRGERIENPFTTA